MKMTLKQRNDMFSRKRKTSYDSHYVIARVNMQISFVNDQEGIP